MQILRILTATALALGLVSASQPLQARRLATCSSARSGVINDLSAMHLESMGETQAHHTCAFFAWHRRMLLALESYMRDLDPKFACLTIPYYDVHSAYANAANKKCKNMFDCSPIFKGLGGAPVSFTQQRATYNGQSTGGYAVKGAPFTNACDDNKKLCGAMLRDNLEKKSVPSGAGFSSFLAIMTRSKDYASFLEGIQFGLHNEVHNAVGGTMSTLASPSDVIFYSWHGAIDMYLSAFHQCHLGSGHKADPMSREAFTLTTQSCGGASGVGVDSKVYQRFKVNGKLVDATQHPLLGKYFAKLGDTMGHFGDTTMLGEFSYTYEFPSIIKTQVLSNKDICKGVDATPAPTTPKPTTPTPTTPKPTTPTPTTPKPTTPTSTTQTPSTPSSTAPKTPTVTMPPPTTPTPTTPTLTPTLTTPTPTPTASNGADNTTGSNNTTAAPSMTPSSGSGSNSGSHDGANNTVTLPTTQPTAVPTNQPTVAPHTGIVVIKETSAPSTTTTPPITTTPPAAGKPPAYGYGFSDNLGSNDDVGTVGSHGSASGSGSGSGNITGYASVGDVDPKDTEATSGSYWEWVAKTYDGLVKRFDGDMAVVTEQMRVIECMAFDKVFGVVAFSDDFVTNFHLASSKPVCGKKIEAVASGNVTVAIEKAAVAFKPDEVAFAAPAVIEVVKQEAAKEAASPVVEKPQINAAFIQTAEKNLQEAASGIDTRAGNEAASPTTEKARKKKVKKDKKHRQCAN